MSNIAVINLGGSQHLVKAGDKFEVNRLKEEAGAELKLEVILSTDGDKVLFNAGDLEAKVVEHTKGDKLYVVKFKAKSRYRRRTGHRQALSVVEILSINGEKKTPSLKLQGKSKEQRTENKEQRVESKKAPGTKSQTRKKIKA